MSRTRRIVFFVITVIAIAIGLSSDSTTQPVCGQPLSANSFGRERDSGTGFCVPGNSSCVQVN